MSNKIIILFVILLITPFLASATLETSWYRGDYFLTDFGTSNNTLVNLGGLQTTANRILYNSSTFTGAASNYAENNSIPHYITGNNDTSVCYFINISGSVNSGDFIVLFWGKNSAGQSRAFGYETGQMAFFAYSDNAMKAFTQKQNFYEQHCFTYTGSNKTVEFWQNGTSLGTTALTSNLATSSGGYFQLNRWQNTNMGSIASVVDIRVFNFTLTSANISTLRNNGLGTNLSLDGTNPITMPVGPPSAPTFATPTPANNTITLNVSFINVSCIASNVSLWMDTTSAVTPVAINKPTGYFNWQVNFTTSNTYYYKAGCANESGVSVNTTIYKMVYAYPSVPVSGTCTMSSLPFGQAWKFG